jgi:cytochrome b
MNVKLNFWIDIATFLGFMVALQPGLTGTTVHEWFTMAAVGTLIVHFVLHWDWFMRLTSRYFVKLYHSSRLNYLMAILIFLGFTSIIVSGLMISQHFMPFWGFNFDSRFAWRRIHSLAANLTLVLVAIHVAMRWEWVKAAFMRLIVEPFRKTTQKADAVLFEEDGM